MLGHKTSPIKFNKIEIIYSIIFSHNRIKLEMSSKGKELAKCLQHKHEDKSSIPSSAVRAGCEGECLESQSWRRGRGSLGHRAGQPSLIVDTKLSESLSQKKWKVIKEDMTFTSGLRMHSHTCIHTHTNTHTRTGKGVNK